MSDPATVTPLTFRAIIADRMGLVFEDDKSNQLDAVLAHRLAARGCTQDDYLAELAHSASIDELGAIAREVTVPETYFFRHLDQFEALREVALPAAISGPAARKKQLRILSAGCASGEEAYSIAILIREMGLDASWKVSIRAVDLNPAPLKKARAGRYAPWVLRETPAPLIKRWFSADGGAYLIDSEIRSAVTFEQRNLVDADDPLWAHAHYDIVFCRNALMYLSPEKMRDVVARISQALVPGGYLFLGHAETLRGVSDDLRLCESHGAFYYRRPGGNEQGQTVARAAIAPASPPPTARPHSPPSTDWMDVIDRASRYIGKLADETDRPPSDEATEAASRTAEHLQSLLAEERFAEALEQIETALSVDPANPPLRLLRAMLLFHCGDAEQAATVAQSLLRHETLKAGAHHILSLCREKAGDLDGAREHDRAAAYADASFAMPRLHLGLLARRAGRRVEMRRELSQALVLLPRENAARLALFGGGFARQALIDLCASTLNPGIRR
jgi:chemotaxis protein methyltransferase CheR